MIDNRLADHARELGEHFAERFRAAMPAKVRELRQLGLMIGIELKEKSTPYLQKLMERGVLALPAGPTVIRLLPPLVIDRDQIEHVVEALHEVLAP